MSNLNKESASSEVPKTEDDIELQVHDILEKYWLPIDVITKEYHNFHLLIYILSTAINLIISIALGTGLYYIFYNFVGTDLFFNLAIPFIISLVVCICIIILQIEICEKMMYRLYTNVLHKEFADITSRSKFIDAVISDPTRAHHWWWLQYKICSHKEWNLPEENEKSRDKSIIFRRIYRSTELPQAEALPSKNIDYKADDKESNKVKSILLSLLPVVSSKNQNFDEPFDTTSLV